MDAFKKIKKKYSYTLPKYLIAQKPSSPRDAAALLVYNRKTKQVFYDTFAHLDNYLPPKAVIVLNETKVLPARLQVQKETGGTLYILYIQEVDGRIQVMANRMLHPGTKICVKKNKQIAFQVERKEETYYWLQPLFPVKQLHRILERYGMVPLPPYIQHSPLSERERKEKYQTIFAKNKGSIAAPTAALHCTKRLLKKIEKAGHTIQYVTLHVNLGTFAPLTEQQMQQGKLHEEWYEMNAKTLHFLNQAKKQGRPIIAVGTTVVRTLESSVREQGILTTPSGRTDIFIREGYIFKFVDGIITNFHVPESSLLMLVAAFIGRKKVFDLYQEAIHRQFRFFSFGDGMLLL